MSGSDSLVYVLFMGMIFYHAVILLVWMRYRVRMWRLDAFGGTGFSNATVYMITMQRISNNEDVTYIGNHEDIYDVS